MKNGSRPSFSKGQIAVASIGSLLLMAYVDYITGYELIFSAAYLVPVSLCGWFFGKREVWLMSLASGVASWFVDKISDHIYTQAIVQYWNGFMCFLISLATGLLLQRLKRTLEERKKANTELQNALEELRRTTEEIRKLQNGLQVVCAWTHRIKVGETWMNPEEFLRTQLHLQLTHGMSPEAERDMKQETDRAFPTTNPR